MVTMYGKFFEINISDEVSFWIQIGLIFPLVCVPKLTNKPFVRRICDLFMAVGFFTALYLEIEVISVASVATYSFTRSVNLTQSAMNMFVCFEGSVSVYEVYVRRGGGMFFVD